MGVANVDDDMVIPPDWLAKKTSTERCVKVVGYADEGLGRHITIDLLEFAEGIEDYPSFLKNGLRSHFVLVSEGTPVAEFSLRKEGEKIKASKTLHKCDENFGDVVARAFEWLIEDGNPVGIVFQGRKIGVLRPVGQVVR